MVVELVLLGVADRELLDGPVETFARTQVARDHRGPAGPGVRPGQRPAAQPGVVGQLGRVHGRDVHRALHVAQLPDVVLLRHRAIHPQAAGPAEERVGRGLHQPLAVHHPLTLVLELARPGERGQHRFLRLLELQEQRLVRGVAEQQEDERLGADRAHADHLAGEVAEVEAVQHLTAVGRQGLQVLGDRVAQLLDDAGFLLDAEPDHHRWHRLDPVLAVHHVAQLAQRLHAGVPVGPAHVGVAAAHGLL